MTGQPPPNPPQQGMDYGETASVHQTHAADIREKVEPLVGREPLPMWLLVVYGFAVFFGGLYLGSYSGDFSGDSLDYFGGTPRVASKIGGAAGAEQSAELTPAVKGKKIFLANCATCHQTNGLGVAAQYPPLAGSEVVLGGARRPTMIVLKGLQGPITVKGMRFGSAVMQPWEKTLNDQKIAEVLTYVRQEWGNTAGPVTPEGVGALRKELADRKESWTEPDILAVPPDAELPGGAPANSAPGKAIEPEASPVAPPPKA